ncbi:phospholipase D-like domain-containing protein [Aeromonas caviae]|uniref:phospholipase D-like domain-containing protein n=1 Tax=Aeromonas caviae TaxID=648 RepID=UPI00191DE929|nr:phospholipase D-like domain-containing protein [Aeromonas caviae]MBL0664006.1 hypothetical protein [Aeromonas caviae]
MNLHDYKIPNADGPDESLSDYSDISSSGDAHVYFRNLEKELIKRIDSADVVLGCIAWLTSEKIISALSKKQAISIIVQKEDFLRPDIDGRSQWKSYLAGLYSKLKNGLIRYDEGLQGTAIHMMSYCADPTLESVRCVGNHNKEKKPAFPRMHNKFLIFCKVPDDGHENGGFKPYEVWTGSFNFTKNATCSFENAVVLTDPKIVDAFFKEYGQIAALSEPLNWSSDWVEPEFRIGS